MYPLYYIRRPMVDAMVVDNELENKVFSQAYDVVEGIEHANLDFLSMERWD